MLLRHAQAEAEPACATGSDEAARDRARPLSRRGWRDAAALAAGDAFTAHPPETILVSPALRTRETLAALDLPAGTGSTVLEALYLAEPAALRAALAALPAAAGNVLLVGHNPGLLALCRHLARDPAGEATPRHMQRARHLEEGLPTCAMAVFASDAKGWSWLADPACHAALVDLRLPGRRAVGHDH